jgi:hypothetical protein
MHCINHCIHSNDGGASERTPKQLPSPFISIVDLI